LNAKLRGNLQQSTMYNPPVYEMNTRETFSPGFSLGFPTSGQSAPTGSNARAPQEEASHPPLQRNDLRPRANSTSRQDPKIINFFNNEIIINQSVNHISRFP